MVHLITDAYARVRHLVPEIARFGVVGAIGAVVDLGGTSVLYGTFRLGPLTAKAVAVICACVVTYLGNRFWTFRHRGNQPLLRETTLFFVLNAVGLLIAEVVIAITAYAFGAKDQVAYNLASVIGTGLGTIFRFWAYRKWVFLAPLIPNERPVPAHHDPTVAAGQSAHAAPGVVSRPVSGTGPMPVFGSGAPGSASRAERPNGAANPAVTRPTNGAAHRKPQPTRSTGPNPAADT